MRPGTKVQITFTGTVAGVNGDHLTLDTDHTGAPEVTMPLKELNYLDATSTRIASYAPGTIISDGKGSLWRALSSDHTDLRGDQQQFQLVREVNREGWLTLGTAIVTVRSELVRPIRPISEISEVSE